jgi:branched-chain amino acid transport system permease protein
MTGRRRRITLVVVWGVVAAAIVLMPLLADRYTLHLLILAGIAAMLAVSLNLIFGLAGQPFFAQGAFYGIGAYTSAILAARYGWSFWAAMAAAGTVTSMFAVAIGPVLRLQGPYFAIATIGVQQMFGAVLLVWTPVTGGPSGITGVPLPWLLWIEIQDLPQFYYLMLVIVLLMTLLSLGIVRSGLGLEMRAVRDDETAARAIGVNSTLVKLIAFAIGAFLAGVAGSFYAGYIGSIDPSTFNIGVSATTIVMVLVGGMGSVFGSIFGALVLTFLPEMLRTAEAFRLIAYGLLLILIILFLPNGVGDVVTRTAAAVRRLRRVAAPDTNDPDSDAAPSVLSHRE